MADWEAVLERAVKALGGDDRPGQRTLAAAVDAAVSGGHHLVAEAPTGSGKSLAYLAPAIASGKKVVVSTATLTLQDQLWHKDLPHLREHGGVDVHGRAAEGPVAVRVPGQARTGRATGDGRCSTSGRARPSHVDLERLGAVRGELGTRATSPTSTSPTPRAAPRAARPMECPGAAKCSDGDDVLRREGPEAGDRRPTSSS